MKLFIINDRTMIELESDYLYICKLVRIDRTELNVRMCLSSPRFCKVARKHDTCYSNLFRENDARLCSSETRTDRKAMHRRHVAFLSVLF